jgi:NodT family efflux transporter outer membrane factor (OMF) lipoprotein
MIPLRRRSTLRNLFGTWRTLRRGFVLGTPLLLTGCMVGPKYKVPVAATAPAFKEADPSLYKETPDWHIAKPGDTLPRGDWWTIFNDPGLNALEPQVATANQNLKIADANLRNARAFIKVQRSNLYPTIGTQPFAGALRDSANQPYFNAANANNGDANLLLPLEVNWEVDLWGAIHRGVNAASEESQATAADRQTALLSLQAEVAMDYFNLRAADAQQKLLNDTVAQYENAVRITNNRFQGGVAIKADLTQAQTQLQDAKVTAADIAIARAQYEHAIAVLIGEPPASFSLPPAPRISRRSTSPLRPDSRASASPPSSASPASSTRLGPRWARHFSMPAAAAGSPSRPSPDTTRPRRPIARPCSPPIGRWRTISWRCAYWLTRLSSSDRPRRLRRSPSASSTTATWAA